MKCFFFRISCVLFLLILFLESHSQKKIIDSADFFKQPEIEDPLISPDGKFVSYSLNDFANGENKVIFSGVQSDWSRTFTVSGSPEVMLNETIAGFNKGNDSIGIVTLGGNIQYLVGYKTFRISKYDPNIIAAWRPNELLFMNAKRTISISNVTSYRFVMNDRYLLMHIIDTINGQASQKIILFNVNNFSRFQFWSGIGLRSEVLSSDECIYSFICKGGESDTCKSIVILNLQDRRISESKLVDTTKVIDRLIGFTKFNKSLILVLKDKYFEKYTPNDLQLKIWSYSDQKIQSKQINDLRPREFIAGISMTNGEFIELERDKDDWNIFVHPSEWGDRWLISEFRGDCNPVEDWNAACNRKWFWIDISTGKRNEIMQFSGTHFNYQLSPNGEHIVYFDYKRDSYYCYSIKSDKVFELTNGKKNFLFARGKLDTTKYIPYSPRGIAGWSNDYKAVYIYDSHDIWMFDLNGRTSPMNITKGYGAENKIVLSFLEQGRKCILQPSAPAILTGLNTETKDNGFFKIISCNTSTKPIQLSMGPQIAYLPFYSVDRSNGMKPIKASRKEVYIVKRESCMQFPNYFTTCDFKTFIPFTNLNPYQHLKWAKSELHKWVLPDGKITQGVLYKPENFDSTRRYPIIFNIYEKLSNSLNAYIEPEPLCDGCEVNPIYLASNDYLVFRPDIYYKPNKTGEMALTTVKSAAEYLGRFKWADTSRMGIQGCSFGGYETNYIVTHSNLFKAACSASAVSELFSYYSGEYESTFTAFSYGQYRMTKDPWKAPTEFILSSPLFYVENITTPLLLFHTTKDDAVDFTQSIQFYLIMRRLNKPVWLLEYGGGNHGLYRNNDKVDFGYRMLQFFDYYLKRTPEPKWMKMGVSAREAKYSTGLELVR